MKQFENRHIQTFSVLSYWEISLKKKENGFGNKMVGTKGCYSSQQASVWSADKNVQSLNLILLCYDFAMTTLYLVFASAAFVISVTTFIQNIKTFFFLKVPKWEKKSSKAIKWSLFTQKVTYICNKKMWARISMRTKQSTKQQSDTLSPVSSFSRHFGVCLVSLPICTLNAPWTSKLYWER